MMKILSPLTASSSITTSAALLVLRLTAGGMMAIGHGWPKVKMFGADPSKFPDPLGIGAAMSYYGAVGGELIGAALVAVGLFTRLACLPAMFAMGVAAFIIHRNDPLFMPLPAKEPALIYLAMFGAVLLAGPGQFSLDAVLFGKRRAAPATHAGA